jgi:hypothetical protein
MPSLPERYPFTPAGRVAVLALILALLGAASIVAFIARSRVEISLLALPVALGLLTRWEFCRKAALAYAVLHAAFTFGFVSFLLRIAISQPAATATGLYAPWHPTFQSIASTAFVVTFAFTVLRQPDVKAQFRPFAASPGA